MNESSEVVSPADQGEPTAASRRRRWVTLLLVAVIFLAGALFGAGATVAVVIRNIQMAIKDPTVVPERAAKRLRWSLDLDEVQALEVREILFDLQRRIQRIRGRVYPEIQLEIKRSRDEITAVLDADQQQAWEELYAKIERRWFPPPPSSFPDDAE
ncbi:MAG: hypothetical protein MI757_13225 [Pirellulales bacterium]|nr:hypothetical protein [Pirellulales bacterium]